jgi:hypothetical protein
LSFPSDPQLLLFVLLFCHPVGSAVAVVAAAVVAAAVVAGVVAVVRFKSSS